MFSSHSPHRIRSLYGVEFGAKWHVECGKRPNTNDSTFCLRGGVLPQSVATDKGNIVRRRKGV